MISGYSSRCNQPKHGLSENHIISTGYFGKELQIYDSGLGEIPCWSLSWSLWSVRSCETHRGNLGSPRQPVGPPPTPMGLWMYLLPALHGWRTTLINLKRKAIEALKGEGHLKWREGKRLRSLALILGTTRQLYLCTLQPGLWDWD